MGTKVCPPYFISGYSDSVLSLTSTQAFSMYIVCLGSAHSGSQPFSSEILVKLANEYIKLLQASIHYV